jgi:hypothetical protein
MNRTTLAAATLFAAWAAHDTEELLTMQATSKEMASRAPQWVPIPEDVRRNGFSQKHFRVAVGIMAAFVAAAAADGARTRGRSGFYRTVVQGFGWHGVGHLAMAAARRGYVSGAATSPVIVIPYWLWARRELARDGAPLESSGIRSMLLVPPVIIGAHLAARALVRQGSGIE